MDGIYTKYMDLGNNSDENLSIKELDTNDETHVTDFVDLYGMSLENGSVYTSVYNHDDDCDSNFEYGFKSYVGGLQTISGVQRVMYFYILPILIVTGVLVNIVVFYIVKHSPLQKISVCVYLNAYTISNILSLLFNSGVDLIFMMVGEKHFQNYSDTVCRLWQFFIRLVTYSGIWFVVAMAIDRYIVVWHRNKRKQLCTIFIAKITVIFILSGMVCLSVHAMWTYELFCGWCFINNKQPDFHRSVWPWVSGMLYAHIPLLLICCIGGLTMFRLRCCDTKIRARCMTRIDRLRIELTNVTGAICCLYFLLYTPATLATIIDNIIPATWRRDADFMTKMENWREISQCLAMINYTASFPVLFIFCDVFRLRLFRRVPRLKSKKLTMKCTAV